MSTKSHLNQSISAFASELVAFVHRAQDSINSLKRTAEQRPQAGVQDFRECLDDLEQQVADFTDEIQQLVGCTSDTISFEELIGHCTAVYSTNRANIIALEHHLAQYGYQQAPGTSFEPENPDVLIYEQGCDGLPAAKNSSRDSLELLAGTGQQRLCQSTPGSPVSKSNNGGLRYVPNKLCVSQPSSPLAARKTPAAAAATPWAAAGLQDFSSMSSMRLGAAAAAAVDPFTALHGRTLATEALTQLKQERQSLGAVSNSSSTPAGLLISPGVAALANKYAISSVGGSSVGALSTPQEPSTGPPISDKRPPCRDLSLSYSLADMNSPDLPIFGMTPASNGSRAQQHELQPPSQHAAAHSRGTPVVTAGKGSSEDQEDSTGELYCSLIHSNLSGVASEDDRMQQDQEPVTPPCAPNSCPSSPKAPATAGRLPAEWHSKKMQELENLQADLTITLSQMKRTPSRSRLTALAASVRDDDDHDETDQQQQQQQQQRGQQQHLLPSLQQKQEKEQTMMQGQQPRTAAAAGGAAENHSANTATITATSTHQLLPSNNQVKQTAAEIGASAATARVSKAAAAKAAVSAATAAAAAATADLESLMASLSMKYVPSDVSAGSNASRAASTVGSSNASSAAGTARSTPTPDQDSSEQASPRSPPESEDKGLSANETSLIMKYAAGAAAAKSAKAATAAAAAESAPDTEQLPPPSASHSPEKLSRLAAKERAALADRPLANLSIASTASDGAGLRHSTSSSTAAAAGQPHLAAAVVAGMEAWRTAVHMDCPSPLSPCSPASNTSHPAAAAVGPTGNSADTMCSPQAAATPEVSANSAGVDVQGSSLLTPATQLAIKYAVAAAGLNTAANRPKSSIRRMQPTTDLSRLDQMRGQLQHQHRGLAESFDQARDPRQRQQYQQKSLAENLESRLAGASLHPEECSGNSIFSTRPAALAEQDNLQQLQHKPDMLLSLRKQKEDTAAAVLQKQVLQMQQEEEKLTPRAARLQRRQYAQEQQQQAKQKSQHTGTSVLRSLENTTFQNNNSTYTPTGKPAAAVTATEALISSSASKGKVGSSSGQKGAVPAVVVKVRPVSADEFAGLPGWCRGLLSVDVLNAAMDELSEMVAGRAGKRSSSSEGFTAADLELLGHSSSKSKTIVSCLHKLSRATLQRSAAGSNIYKLMGTAV